MALAIPSAVDQVTPEWLSEALGGDATVERFDVEPVGVGVGLMSLLYRLTPTYADGAGPASVILKIAPPYPAVREVALGYGFYEREVRIYTELGDDVGLRPAHCHHGAHDRESDDFVLLIEDLGGCRTADQLDGCTPDDARRIVRALAEHHARWWESPRLRDLPYLPSPADPPFPEFQERSSKAQWPIVLERFGDRIPDRIKALGERWPEIGAPLMRDSPNHPVTLGHGDVRLDNVFFHDDGGDPVTVVDWQISFRTNGTFDLGYFTSQSLTVEDRRACEDELCHLYLDTLVEHGVTGFGWDDLWEGYRRAVLFSFSYPMGGGAVELVNDRAWALATAMLDRSIAAIVDLDADELVP